MRQDCKEKRVQFIDASVKTRETFKFAHPSEQISAVEKYCTAVYGSNLWDLRSPEAEMVYNSWKTSVKLSWNVPRGCRTYLLQNFLAPGLISLRVNIMTRFRSFFRSLMSSPSKEVQIVSRLAARDMRSTLRSNLALLREETGLDPWIVSPAHLRRELISAETSSIPAEDQWRVPYLKKLLDQRNSAYYCGEQEREEHLQKLIDSLVVN